MWISKKKFEKLSSNLSAKLNVELYMKINELQQIIRRKEQYNNNLNKYCMELRSLDSLNNKKIEQLTEENTRLGRTNIGLVMQCKDAYERIQELNDILKSHPIYVCEPLPEKKKEKPFIKPTYFTMNENRQCFDLCEIKNDGTKIGSRLCRECISCKAVNDGEKWIKCSERPDGNSVKRDKFGVISKAEEHNSPCDSCIYKDYDSSEAVCVHCTANLKQNEYYSSK